MQKAFLMVGKVNGKCTAEIMRLVVVLRMSAMSVFRLSERSALMPAVRF